MTFSLWTLAGLFLLGVSPFAIAAASCVEQCRTLTVRISALTTALAAARAHAADLERACHRYQAEARRLSTVAGTLVEANVQLQAPAVAEAVVAPAGEGVELPPAASRGTTVPAWCEVVPEPRSVPHLAALEAQATAHAVAYLVLAQAAVCIQQRLIASRGEILRLDTALRRQLAQRAEGDVSDVEWAAIVEAARTQTSRTAVARALFGHTGKAAYAKVKHVCDAEGLLMPEVRTVKGMRAGVSPPSEAAAGASDHRSIVTPALCADEVMGARAAERDVGDGATAAILENA